MKKLRSLGNVVARIAAGLCVVIDPGNSEIHNLENMRWETAIPQSLE